MDAIGAYGLTKQYGDTLAIDKLNLELPEGAAFAFLGTKGAGKTTLIRLLSGLSRPTDGTCTVLGISPYFEAARLHASVGTALSSAKLYQRMTVSENLRFFADLAGVEENDALDRQSLLLHGLGIWESRDELIGELPTGVVCRAGLAQALIHSPRVLLMDEPGFALNRETAEAILSLLETLVREEGLTLLLATGNTEFAQRLCGGFALLDHGVVLARGDRESLRKGAGVGFRAILRLGPEDTGPRGFRPVDGCWEKELAEEQELARVIAQTVNEGKTLYEARLVQPTMDDIFAAYRAGGANRPSLEEDDLDAEGAESGQTPGEGDGEPQPQGQPEGETAGLVDPQPVFLGGDGAGPQGPEHDLE